MSASLPGGRRGLLCVACTLLFSLMTLAPTPGDVGGCQPARPLDEAAFFRAKRSVDCQRCEECAIVSSHCQRACDDVRTASESFPDGCAPLAHDGAVCLRALYTASCDDYGAYANDERPQVPSECDFCPRAARGGAQE